MDINIRHRGKVYRMSKWRNKMDNQDLTLERRLKAKDKLIAELLEALEELVTLTEELIPDVWMGDVGTINLAHKAIRKAKGE